MADSGVPPASSQASDVAEEEIPTNLPSDVGMDYVPLATMLATGQLAEADQVRFFLVFVLLLYNIPLCVCVCLLQLDHLRGVLNSIGLRGDRKS